MSVGILRHPIFGEAKEYILNTKQVLQIRHDVKSTDDWSVQYQHLKETYLKKQQIKFYLLPQEIYLEKDNNYTEDQFYKPQTSRIILYDHFAVTLREELKTRIESQEKFTKSELWYFLYGLTCGALQMIRIYQQNPNSEQPEISFDNILLNEYGYLKIVGYFSTPQSKKRGSLKSIIEKRITSTPSNYELCCSLGLGRILACLVMLKDIDDFYEGKPQTFNEARLHKQLIKYEQQIGMIYNILQVMLTDSSGQRILISEVKGLLLPYQNQILAQKDFIIDRQTSRKSLLQLFVEQS